MTLPKTLIETLRVSGGIFMLLWVASTLSVLLLMLLTVSTIANIAKQTGS